MESYKTEAVTAHGGFFFLYFSGKRDLILEITLRGVAFWEQVDGSSWGGGFCRLHFPIASPGVTPALGDMAWGGRGGPGGGCVCMLSVRSICYR